MRPGAQCRGCPSDELEVLVLDPAVALVGRSAVGAVAPATLRGFRSGHPAALAAAPAPQGGHRHQPRKPPRRQRRRRTLLRSTRCCRAAWRTLRANWRRPISRCLGWRLSSRAAARVALCLATSLGEAQRSSPDLRGAPSGPAMPCCSAALSPVLQILRRGAGPLLRLGRFHHHCDTPRRSEEARRKVLAAARRPARAEVARRRRFVEVSSAELIMLARPPLVGARPISARPGRLTKAQPALVASVATHRRAAPPMALEAPAAVVRGRSPAGRLLRLVSALLA